MIEKQCIKCERTKSLESFRKHKECKYGRANTCKDCFKNWTLQYEKTPKGFLMRLYRNMKSRITGVQKKKHHLYSGKYLLPKDEFYKWAKDCEDFWFLFEKYKNSDFEQRLAPSVDRVDPDKGYSIDNMEWVTHSENSRRSSKTRKRNV